MVDETKKTEADDDNSDSNNEGKETTEKKDDNKTTPKKSPDILMLLLPLLLAITVFLRGTEESVKNYVEKEPLTKKIVTAISNDADLRAIKQIFENREIRKK